MTETKLTPEQEAALTRAVELMTSQVSQVILRGLVRLFPALGNPDGADEASKEAAARFAAIIGTGGGFVSASAFGLGPERTRELWDGVSGPTIDEAVKAVAEVEAEDRAAGIA